MLKEVISPDSLYKATITQHSDGLFEIEYFKRTKR